MGIPYGKLWNDAAERDLQCTPLSARRPPKKILSLAALDPRSPSSEITRTPIHVESVFHEEVNDGDLERDPRSPTTAFQRTPLPTGKVPSSETVLQEKSSIGPNDKKDGGHESKFEPADCETPKERKSAITIRAVPLGENGFGGTRSPLKAVTHPNCLRKSAHRNRVRRQKTADDVLGKSADEDKENSFVSTEA